MRSDLEEPVALFEFSYLTFEAEGNFDDGLGKNRGEFLARGRHVVAMHCITAGDTSILRNKLSLIIEMGMEN